MTTENKPDFRAHLMAFLKYCQTEINKAVRIGKRMLYASKLNNERRAYLIQVGLLAVDDLKNSALHWENPKVTELISSIAACEKQIEELEGEVQEIKRT